MLFFVRAWLFCSFLPPGTGKTATFAVSILQKIDPTLTDCQALVLAPTRELAQQIVKVVRALGDYMSLNVSHPSIRKEEIKQNVRCTAGWCLFLSLFWGGHDME